MGPHKILGYSVANVEQALFGQSKGADYLGAGTVYPTSSKSDTGLAIGTEVLKKIKQHVSLPVVGIGGIGISNIEEVKMTGIDGISLVSAILGSMDIEATSRALFNIWRK